MAEYIKKIRTDKGDLQIDYNALANLPTTDTTLTIANKAADAQATGNAINELSSNVADVVEQFSNEIVNVRSEIGTEVVNLDAKINTKVAQSTTINGYSLDQDIVLTAEDVGAFYQTDVTLQMAGAPADAAAVGAAVDNITNSLQELVGDEPVLEQIQSAVSELSYGICLVDEINNYEYIIQMHNGTLVSSMKSKQIIISTLPDRMDYSAGDVIDTAGMIVEAICLDDSTKIISKYECSTVNTEGMVQVSYVECGTTYTVDLAVNLITDV